VSLYLDCNVIIALLTADALADRAAQFEWPGDETLIVSDFGAAEFAAVISRRVRIRALTRAEARVALDRFDEWVGRSPRRVEIAPADVATAEGYLRRLDLTLLAPDAIHIAIARRVGASLITFDRAMATAARALGVPVADL
jgi:hypothetical protein